MSRLARIVFLGVSMTCIAAAGRVHADDFASRLFGATPPGPQTRVCFVRHYDAEHLGRHPRQNVKDMMMLVGLQPIEGETTTNYAFQLSTHFTKLASRLESGGSCGEAKGDHLACSVDCDGGGLTIRPSVDGKLITAAVDNIRVWRTGTAPKRPRRTLMSAVTTRCFALSAPTSANARRCCRNRSG